MARDIRYQPRDRSGGRGQVSDLKPQYIAASWKGVPFFCESSSDEFGRRGEVYEYPLSNRIAYKDLGQRARRFKIEGYLIGPAQIQINLTREMKLKAEEPNPGWLMHPIYGEQMVACVTCAMTQDYKKDKKRTKVSFEFVQASEALAVYQIGGTADSIFNAGSDAVNKSWQPGTAFDVNGAKDISQNLQKAIGDPSSPFGMLQVANDEKALDAIGRLGTIGQATSPIPTFAQVPAPTPAIARSEPSYVSTPYMPMPRPLNAARIIGPIDYGAATVRRLHVDALERLKDFNAFVVQRAEQLPYSASVQSLVITTRLIIAREMAVSMMGRAYETVKAALDDLDLIVAIYDEEEAEATRRCDDVLVAAIRRARGVAIEVILVRSIRLPGIVEFAVDGLWPSLIVAQKLYADGQRYEQIEKYNQTMLPFWLGRHVIGPAR